MPEAERAAAIEEFDLAEYERYAAGGRTRAARAASGRWYIPLAP
jgi:hypothetical protein